MDLLKSFFPVAKLCKQCRATLERPDRWHGGVGELIASANSQCQLCRIGLRSLLYQCPSTDAERDLCAAESEVFLTVDRARPGQTKLYVKVSGKSVPLLQEKTPVNSELVTQGVTPGEFPQVLAV